MGEKEAGEMAQWLSAFTAFQRIQIQFPGPKMMPIIVERELIPPSCPLTFICHVIDTCIHIHTKKCRNFSATVSQIPMIL